MSKILLSTLASAVLLAMYAPNSFADDWTCSDKENPCPGQGEWLICHPDALFRNYVPDLPKGQVRADSATDVSADEMQGVSQKRYQLKGNVELRRADQRLATDLMDYNQANATLDASGGVSYQDKTVYIQAQTAHADLANDKTRLEQINYQLLNARGNGKATSAELQGDNKTQLTQVTYSTCDPGDIDWEFRAEQIDVNHETGVGRGKNLSLRFKGVPIFYLPVASFPVDNRRKTGLLYPRLASSNNGGFEVSLPYYLNLAPNYDATITPRAISKRGLMMGGEFRYLTQSSHGELLTSYMSNDRLLARERSSYTFRNWSTITEQLFFTADLNKVSDDRYFEDFGDSLTTAATSLLPSSLYLNGRGEWWSMAFGADDFEVTDPRLTSADAPYRRLPRFIAAIEKPVLDWLELGLKSELVKFDKDNTYTGTRYDFKPYIAFPFERAAGFVRPQLALRHTRYDLQNYTVNKLDRNTPITSLDAGLFFDRSVNWFSKELRQTLEPRAYYLHVPFREQSQIPLFDTQEMTFGFSQLFRDNRYSGADRQMDANQLTVAVTSRLLDDAFGNELARVSLGQIRYFDDRRVQLPGIAGQDVSRSAYVGELGLSLSDNWNVSFSQQWDPSISRTDLSAVRLQHIWDNGALMNLAYRYRRDQIEQVDASAVMPLSARMRLVTRYNYSLLDARTLEAFAGLEFESCCYAVRILGRHYVRNTSGDSNNALFLEFELKGLGSFGRKTGELLQRAILGYQRESY